MSRQHIRKRNLGSFPFLSVVFSVTLSLLVIGIFGLLMLLASSLTSLIQQNIELQVYLNKQIRNSEISRIQRTLGVKEYVLNTEDSPGVRLITEEEAARQFISDTGEDFTSFLGDNPLRDLFTVKIAPAYQSPDSLQLVAADIESLGGVYEVSYVESLVKSINDNLTKIGAILLGVAIILLLVVVILINNTIKLALFSQRFLIRSMQLVGATGSFIKAPFLRRSIVYGLGSGLVASGAIYGILFWLNQQMEDLQQLQSQEKLLLLFAGIIIIGVAVTYISTYFAVKKYLKTSLDELY